MNTTTLPLRLEMRRTFDAPLERVFAAWTDLNQFIKWLGCSSSKLTKSRGDISTGGHFRLELTTETGDHVLEGKYKEVTPLSRLVFSWQWLTPTAKGDGETWVTVQFRAIQDKTEIHLVHEGFATDENCENHSKGWGMSFDRLATLLSA